MASLISIIFITQECVLFYYNQTVS